MLTATEYTWIIKAMDTLNRGDVSEMSAAKTYRTIGQIFEGAAQKVELALIDKVEDRLYNTNTQTEGATHA